jgi:chromate reductase, NAD(P)H dehydrogenase (quinone)
MDGIRLLIIPGSARAGSLNRQLAAAAAAAARKAGAAVTELDLRELALPVYDGDLEAASGIPAGADSLHEAMLACDALLIVTPEYNGFPTPLVINAFDWLSRIPAQPPRVSGLAATANKPAGVLAASPGPLGALRSLNFLRQYLQMAFAMIVVPQQFALGKANDAFDETGGLKEPKAAQSVDNVLRSLGRLARALKAPT